MTTPPTSESRLDALVGALREHEPALDEVTRARVGADLASALRNPAPPPASFFSRLFAAPSRRWLAGGLALAATTAIVFVVRASSDSTSPTHTSPDLAGTASSGAPTAVGTSSSAATPVLAPGHPVDVAAGATARVAVADADITIYGPGRIETSASSGASATGALVATVDADAATIDRSHGDGTLALRYDTLEVHVTHATFAFDRKRTPRVTVMRGELLLRCLHSDRTIHAGESASCADGPPTITASLGTPSDGTVVPAPGQLSDAPAASGRISDVPSGRIPDMPAASGRTSDVRPSRTGGDLAGPPAGLRPVSGTRTARAAAPSSGDLGGNPFVRTADPATDLYATADEALRRGDRDAARAALEKIVSAQPASTDAAAALLDLARLDAASDPGIALRRLDALDAQPRGAALAEPAAHLRCTIVDGDAELDCLAGFVERFPRSPRTAAALARLATRRAATDCAAAAPLLADYLARFPRGADAAAVTAWRDRCASPR